MSCQRQKKFRNDTIMKKGGKNLIHKPIRLLQKYFDSLNFSELVYRVEEDGAHSCFTILVIDAYGGLWPLRYIAGANSDELSPSHDVFFPRRLSRSI